MLSYDRHPQVQACVKALNRFYRNTPAMFEVEDSWDGFQWITASDTDNSVFAFLRTDEKGSAILCVANFTPVFHPIYRVGLPQEGHAPRGIQHRPPGVRRQRPVQRL